MKMMKKDAGKREYAAADTVDRLNLLMYGKGHVLERCPSGLRRRS